jgi:N-acetylglucosaminyl-diphospho-decaprenol L-rhamnosyltransferase|tara:strand:+ start:334 stop:1188 length:855 start_codon:yes stop_codon:yes gene_type:complete
MNYQEKLTVIIVAFHSNAIIESLINQLDQSIKILIIENSKDFNLKSKLENKYSNVEVIIPDKNIGVGAAINIGLKNTKTKYSLQISADVLIDKNMIQSLLETADKIENFSIIAPRDHSYHYGNEMYINPLEKNKLHQMNLVAGFAMLINMQNLSKIGLFDEKIFLYFEEFDFCLRCNKAKLPIYLSDEAKINHKGNSSVNKKYNYQIEINRNWHYCWSKFYYFKKHYGYLYGLKKTLPNLVRSIKRCVYYLITGNKKNFLIQKAEISGLLSSYALRESFYRPKI